MRNLVHRRWSRRLLLLALAVAPGAAAQTRAVRPADPQSALSMIRAAELGDADAVARYLGIGVPVDSRDRDGRTALLAAVQGNHLEAARILLAAGANVNAKAANEDSPFLLAGASGRTEILRLILKAGADLRATNRYGGTALIPAAHYGHVETVRLLLTTDIAVDHINRLGWTALLEAVILGDGGPRHREIALLLLGAGADPNRADREGVTPLQHARRLGQTEMAALIAREGGR